ncbi:MAG: primosomal protein N' [Bulleidia sp.]
MEIVKCWIEHPIRNLDQTYDYISDTHVMPGCRVRVPFGNRQVIGFVEAVEPLDEPQKTYEERHGIHLKAITEVIDHTPLINEELHDLALYMKTITISPTISCFQTILTGKVRPSSTSGTAVQEKHVRVSDKEVSLTPKQLQAYMFVQQAGEMKYSDLRKAFPNQARALIDRGALEVTVKEREAQSEALSIAPCPYPLTPLQNRILDEIRQSGDSVFLLKGVTGSGKTEVYFQLAQETLKQGRQVLFLVPEIALTPQMIARVKTRFGNCLAVYHSSLSDQQKYEQYRLVSNGRACIVVGTRSAVFLPFQDLGLIIMDEEHDTSYKQDVQPCYHTRDMAMFRAEYHHAKLIMGSATPSLDSYARALKGIYHLLVMDERVNACMPEVRLVDMKKAKSGESEVISDELKDGIALRLSQRKQVILLLNRRGFHNKIRCRSCDEVLMCPHCEIAMSYHKDIRRMKCHTCGYEMMVPKRCPSCGSTDGFTTYGFGTQKLQETVEQMFPEARVLRMDADTTNRKNAHQKILDAFGRKEADILIGTQMIAKGLDYPDVTLVGIINADEGLYRTDYRSCEETFDLLMQAGGRSGRKDSAGQVILQVYDPGHEVLQCVVRHDYDAFYRMEMHYRHMAMMPPYTYLICISVTSKYRKKCDETALAIRNEIHGNFRVIGVISLLRINDCYRNRVILKGRNPDEMRDAVQAWFDSQKTKPEGVRVDVNPLSLL